MLTAGLIVLALGVLVMIGAGRVTAQQSRRAGADPARGELAYSWQGGVSRATSAAMLGAWALLLVGLALTVGGLL